MTTFFSFSIVMRVLRNHRPPLFALTTDFGLCDHYVSAVKAVLLTACPTAQIVDVTHEVPPQDLVTGAILLERALSSFSRGTIHLAVVDPGVGTERRILIAEIRGQRVICPDNGLITCADHCLGAGTYWELYWRPTVMSQTFHAREIMAPVAARLAKGTRINAIARRITNPIQLDLRPYKLSDRAGNIIHIDRYGNAITNIPAHMTSQMEVVLPNRRRLAIRRTYSDVRVRESVALIGSSGLLEIAVRNGSAARQLKLHVGDLVKLAPQN